MYPPLTHLGSSVRHTKKIFPFRSLLSVGRLTHTQPTTARLDMLRYTPKTFLSIGEPNGSHNIPPRNICTHTFLCFATLRLYARAKVTAPHHFRNGGAVVLLKKNVKKLFFSL